VDHLELRRQLDYPVAVGGIVLVAVAAWVVDVGVSDTGVEEAAAWLDGDAAVAPDPAAVARARNRVEGGLARRVGQVDRPEPAVREEARGVELVAEGRDRHVPRRAD